jgi:hypothetical protein
MNTNFRSIVLPVGSVGVWLILLWLYRTPAVPLGDGEAFFRVQAEHQDAVMVQVSVQPMDEMQKGMPSLGMVEDDIDLALGGLIENWRKRGDAAPVPSAPRMMMPRPESDRARQSLFDPDSLDPYDGMNSEPASASWGWLADDVSAADRGTLDRRAERQSVGRDHRFLDNGSGDSLGRGRSSSSSDDDYFFQRQDRRF